MPAPTLDSRHQDIAALLIQSRRERDWLQKDLAERMRRSQTFVSKYETGLRRLDVIDLLDILRALDADPHEYIDQVLTMPKRNVKR